MKSKIRDYAFTWLCLNITFLFLFLSCSDQKITETSTKLNNQKLVPAVKGRPLQVVATTGMIADVAAKIGGDKIVVTSLMGSGVDPHLYKASAGDVERLSQADLILYNGLHLEAGMGGVLERLADQYTHRVFCVTDQLDRSKLMAPPEFEGAYDPHIWFDVSLWSKVAEAIRDILIQRSPSLRDDFQQQAERYLLKLTGLHDYVQKSASQIPSDQRVLVTAHDAFGYFGRAYGFEVLGLQGISTVTEAGTADVRQLAQFIADRQISAIFVESSIPRQSIEAVQAAVRARGFAVKIGGELFSDAMGDSVSDQGTYTGMIRHNIDIIVDGLTEGD